MSDAGYIAKRPTRASFKDKRATHDIYDNQGIKWIAKGQLLSEKQIRVALEKGSLTRHEGQKPIYTPSVSNKFDLKPTFDDVNELTDKIDKLDKARNNDLKQGGKLSQQTRMLINDSSDSIMDLMQSNRFSPYKLTGLTNFLYGESQFENKRDSLKTLNNSGTQFTLFNSIIDDGLKDIVVANLLNPTSYIRELAKPEGHKSLQLSSAEYSQYCHQASQTVLQSIQGTELDTVLTKDLIRYFLPNLYFTSAEIRLHQQINTYLNFLMPDSVTQMMPFEMADTPVLNFVHYFKQGKSDSGLGVEGTRIIQYVGLIPPGTAIQFSNREKGIVIAPKTKDILYSVIITGMDGQPLITPSLREILFRDLNQSYHIIPTYDLPLKYETHSHEKIWKMHLVHEKLKQL